MHLTNELCWSLYPRVSRYFGLIPHCGGPPSPLASYEALSKEQSICQVLRDVGTTSETSGVFDPHSTAAEQYRRLDCQLKALGPESSAYVSLQRTIEEDTQGLPGDSPERTKVCEGEGKNYRAGPGVLVLITVGTSVASLSLQLIRFLFDRFSEFTARLRTRPFGSMALETVVYSTMPRGLPTALGFSLTAFSCHGFLWIFMGFSERMGAYLERESTLRIVRVPQPATPCHPVRGPGTCLCLRWHWVVSSE